MKYTENWNSGLGDCFGTPIDAVAMRDSPTPVFLQNTEITGLAGALLQMLKR
jgi:hypothetical protein